MLAVAHSPATKIANNDLDRVMESSMSRTIVLDLRSSQRCDVSSTDLNLRIVPEPALSPWLPLPRGSSAGRWFQANGEAASRWQILRESRLETKPHWLSTAC